MADQGGDRRRAELQALEATALAGELDQLAQRGAARRAPLDFLLASALQARLQGLESAVSELVRQRLVAAMLECEAVLDSPRASRAPGRPASRTPSPLAALNAQIRQAPARAAGFTTELASAARFRESLARQQALEVNTQAQARKPRKAGPLNSHAIALECLAHMQALSPAYLHQFLQQLEALQWLDQWQGQPLPQPAGKGAAAAARAGARPAAKRGGESGAKQRVGGRSRPARGKPGEA